MRKSLTPLTITVLFGALWSVPAFAYIGPGAGITILGALWGVVVALVLALGTVLFWPLRVLLRRRRNRAAGTGSKKPADASPTHASRLSSDDQATAPPPGTPASAK